MSRDLLLYAECHICRQLLPVPTIKAQNYIMMHQLPCRACFNDDE